MRPTSYFTKKFETDFYRVEFPFKRERREMKARGECITRSVKCFETHFFDQMSSKMYTMRKCEGYFLSHCLGSFLYQSVNVY